MEEVRQNRITVLLDSDMYQLFDRYCKSSGFKKSTLIARLIREHLRTSGFSFQSSYAAGETSSKAPEEKAPQ